MDELQSSRLRRSRKRRIPSISVCPSTCLPEGNSTIRPHAPAEPIRQAEGSSTILYRHILVIPRTRIWKVCATEYSVFKFSTVDKGENLILRMPFDGEDWRMATLGHSKWEDGIMRQCGLARRMLNRRGRMFIWAVERKNGHWHCHMVYSGSEIGGLGAVYDEPCRDPFRAGMYLNKTGNVKASRRWKRNLASVRCVESAVHWGSFRRSWWVRLL